MTPVHFKIKPEIVLTGYDERPESEYNEIEIEGYDDSLFISQEDEYRGQPQMATVCLAPSQAEKLYEILGKYLGKDV